MGFPGEIKFKLSSGAEIPALGIGTVGLRDSAETVKTATLNAIKVGYRHFDTASNYDTEELLGEIFKEVFESGVTKREEVFVTTKLWMDKMSPEQVPVEFHKSLSKLGLEYIDLYLIHFPIRVRPGAPLHQLKEEDFLPLDLKGVWREFEKLKEQGLAKSIGVSNYSVKRLVELSAVATTLPDVNQVEMHPLWQQKKLLDYSKRKGIHVTAYSPFGAPGQHYGVATNGVATTGVLENPVLIEIAAKHGKSTGQVSLRWILQQGASVVPKSYNEKRQVQNADIWSWSLDDEDLEKISGITQEKLINLNAVYNGPKWKSLEEFYDDEE